MNEHENTVSQMKEFTKNLTRVKIISSRSDVVPGADIEDQINKWFMANPGVRVIDVETFSILNAPAIMIFYMEN